MLPFNIYPSNISFYNSKCCMMKLCVAALYVVIKLDVAVLAQPTYDVNRLVSFYLFVLIYKVNHLVIKC